MQTHADVYAELESLLSRIQGPPNSARDNLINSFSCMLALTAFISTMLCCECLCHSVIGKMLGMHLY